MGHHIKNGRFVSDKYPWLPPDLLLVNTRAPEVQEGLNIWLSSTGVSQRWGRQETEGRAPKLLLDFTELTHRPILAAVARGYDKEDSEFAADIRLRLETIEGEIW